MKDRLYSQHKASGILDETNFVQPIRYHRNCYWKYTSKHNLSYRHKTNSSEESHSETHDYLTRSGVNPMDTNKCLFCGYLKKRGDRDLVQVSTFPIQEKIENAAHSLGDCSLLSKGLGKDLIASGSKYHKICLTETLTKTRRMQKKESEDNETTAFDIAFDNLISQIPDDS